MVAAYNQALNSQSTPSSPSAGHAIAAEGLGRWKDLLANFSEDYLRKNTREVYAEETFFNDTLVTLHTAAEVEEHLVKSSRFVPDGGIKFGSAAKAENGDYFVQWEMTLQNKQLNGGEPVTSIGVSQLRFNNAGEVVLHQDFWDSSSGFIEYLPVIGGQLRFVRNKF